MNKKLAQRKLKELQDKVSELEKDTQEKEIENKKLAEQIQQ